MRKDENKNMITLTDEENQQLKLAFDIFHHFFEHSGLEQLTHNRDPRYTMVVSYEDKTKNKEAF